jgi:DNA-binding SARP family transcriptional activator
VLGRAPAEIDARLLGPLELEQHGRPAALGPATQRALLARLLLDAGRTVAVDRLVDDLWGDHVPPTAVKMIHIHVSRLRKLLPADTLVTRPPGYALFLPHQALDLVRFEQLHRRGRAALDGGSAAHAAQCLRQALALWRGPALAEFDRPFAAIEARRLEELRLACLEDRIEADLAHGAYAGLVAELDALVAHDPLRERLQRQLMLALYHSGRQAEALSRYRRFRALVSTELGLEPSPALRELERRILRHDPMLGAAAKREPDPVIGEGGPTRANRILRHTAAPRKRGVCASGTGRRPR